MIILFKITKIVTIIKLLVRQNEVGKVGFMPLMSKLIDCVYVTYSMSK